jgi:hypothetical protein
VRVNQYCRRVNNIWFDLPVDYSIGEWSVGVRVPYQYFFNCGEYLVPSVVAMTNVAARSPRFKRVETMWRGIGIVVFA